MPLKEPRPASFFRLKLSGKEAIGMFRECSGLDSETTVIEQMSIDPNGHPFVRKVPGATKWSNITLKRGVDENCELWKWRDTVVKQGCDPARIDGTIELVDITGAPIAVYQFKFGWPIKYSGATLNASSNDVAVEEVQICHEGMERMP